MTKFFSEQSFQQRLREIIDLEPGFLTELVSSGFEYKELTEYVEYESPSRKRERQGQLIDCIFKKSMQEASRQQFLEALRAVNQGHVANCLERRGRK
jgi:hypothetical protein